MDKKLKILILEDNPSDVDLILRILKNSSIQFLADVASGKEEFIDAISNKGFDVILSDHSLPQFSSVEALEEITNRKLDVNFILVTGTVSEEFAVEMIQKGVDDYILKDNLARLPSALVKALEKREIKNEKMNAERALRESELRYRILFDQASDGIFITNRQGDLMDANQEACKMLGYTLEELLKQNISNSFLKEELEINPILLTEAGAGKTIMNHRKVLRRDGSVIDVETSTKILPDGRCQAIARDITERKKLEEEVRKSEIRFRALIENNTDAIVLRDEHFSMVYSSPSAKRMLGYGAGDNMPARYEEENHPDDLEKIQKCQKAIFENPARPVRLTYRKKHKEGHYIWVEGVMTNMLHNESIKGIISNFRDITEQKKAEQLIVNEKKLSDSVINSLPGIFYLHNESGNFLRWNKNFETVTGYSAEEIKGIRPPDIYDTYENEDRHKKTDTVFKKKTGGIEAILFTKENKRIPYYFNSMSIQYQGAPCLIGMGIDISEQKKAEAAIRESEEKFRRIVETAQEGIWLLNEDFRTIFVNQKMCEILKYSADEIIGKTTLDLMEKEDRAPILEAMKRRKEGISEILDLRFKTGVGTHIWASLSNSTFSDENGNFLGSLSMVTDITQRKKTAEELQQSYKDIRELASHLQNIREEERIQIARDIHDELGQQLTGLKMDVSWLSSKLKVREEPIDEKIKGMTELLDEAVRSVRRISANLRPSILDDLGLEAALEWQSQEVQKRFGIQIKFKSEFPEIDLPVGIATGLFRVYQEALTNAVRHANAHIINSRLLLSGNKIILEIADDGKGMDMKTDTTKKSFGLLGIKERVFVMNGKYEINSEPGKGTFLSVVVPL